MCENREKRKLNLIKINIKVSYKRWKSFKKIHIQYIHIQIPNRDLLRVFSPEGLTASLVFLHVVLQGSRLTLAQPVDVQDSHQVVELVVGGEGHGLPHRALRQLSIAQQTVDSVTAHKSFPFVIRLL